MSLQRLVINFLARYLVRARMTGELDPAKLRQFDSPEPPRWYTYGCLYERDKLGGVPVTLVRPSEATGSGAMAHLHGGVYFAGISPQHWWFLSRVCAETGRLGVMVDYRLAPEDPYPAALDDAVAVMQALTAQFGPGDVVVSGDSAGGGLALAGAMKCRDEGLDLPAKLVLLSPWLDITLSNPEIGPLEKKDRIMARDGVIQAGQWYAAGADPEHPYLSPIYGNLAGLPPALLQIGGNEILLPDCRALLDKGERQGLRLTYQEYANLFHDWTLLFPFLPEGEEALQEVLRYLRA